tara:strand:+ start:9928 stop:10737 length:810 start_codon:yes stop_codon:yes gene_type:complete
MNGKKILFVSSEVIPYLPNNNISSLSYSLPKMVNENGGQTRIFIPKYGIINERRHQLHEVIRLSGMNLIIDDIDMPLIIKVASIPKERMQVYFIDNEEYFKNRGLHVNEDKKLYKDNDERAIFFAKGVVETIKKLNWSPDIIHVHGWIASLLPLYLKEYYKDEPLFSATKVVVSLYENEISGKLSSKIINKIQFDDIESDTLQVLEDKSYKSLSKIAILNSDGVIFANNDVNEVYRDIASSNKIPILECNSPEDFKKEYLNFYNTEILN